ncbi:MAG: c-type cytochrome [Sphingomonadaceae bacterium]
MVSIRASLALSAALLALAACGQQPAEEKAETAATETAPAETAAANAAAPAATTAAGPPPIDNVDTLDGTKLANFTADAANGEKAFAVCKTCHAVEPGKNMVGPSLHGLIGRTSGTIAGFNYTAANKNSGIVWTEDKLFQYLEAPKRIIPGTKMAYTGLKDAQKRADVIAYLKTKS